MSVPPCYLHQEKIRSPYGYLFFQFTHMNLVLKNLTRVAVVGALFVISSCALTAGVTDSADKFFGLVKENKLQEAYTSTAKEFQAATTQDQFKAFLSATTLDKYASASWPSTSITNNTGHIEGTVTTSASAVVPLTMDFVNEDGMWKVLNLKPTAAGVTTSTSTPVLPSETEIVALTNKSMADFADAVTANDFTTMYANLANLWKSQMPLETLQTTFKEFVEKQTDLSFVKTTAPTFSSTPAIDENKVLKINGSYTGNATAIFTLQYFNENSEWKLVGINVNMK